MKLFKRTETTPDERRARARERWALAGGGLALGLSFPPVPAPFLVLVGLVPALAVFERRDRFGDAISGAFLFTFVFSVVSLYWVGGFTEMKDSFLALGGVFTIFLNAFLYLIPFAVYHVARKTFGEKPALYLLPIFWIAFEWWYSATDLAFPWLALANASATVTPFIQIADTIGAHGVSLIIAYFNVVVFVGYIHYRDHKNFRAGVFFAGVLLLVVPILYGAVRLTAIELPNAFVKVGLVQPNRDPHEKWRMSAREQVARYLELSRQSAALGAELIVWPETALPVYLLSGRHPDLVDSIRSFVNNAEIPLITGMPHADVFYKAENAPPDAKYNETRDYYHASYNAALYFSPSSYDVAVHRKSKLVPFSERTPFVDKLPFLRDMIRWGVGISDWNVGGPPEPFLIPPEETPREIPDTLRVGALICYESVFPLIVAEMAAKGTDLFAVVTNDSWWGNTSGAYQHKEIAVLRAVETRRSIVRAANGGISCVIDPMGQIAAETRYGETAQLTVLVPISNERSFFVAHPRVVVYASSLVAFATLLWGAFVALRKRFAKRS
ncbi:MAG: apolipoprotein N-acyltransferase [Ignavibacteriales bacterium]|nr:apolipoprotein N-acyltransferase [Ignavibacteriales bacterium]